MIERNLKELECIHAQYGWRSCSSPHILVIIQQRVEKSLAWQDIISHISTNSNEISKVYSAFHFTYIMFKYYIDNRI